MAQREKQLQSKVFVTVVEAKHLPVADVGGKSDPYVLFKDVKGIRMSGKGIKTPVIKKTLDPVWNEQLPACDWNYKLAKLVFKVYDHDRFSKDDLLCKCAIPIDAFLDGQEHDQWYVLKNKSEGIVAAAHGTSGTPSLHLKIRAEVHLPLVWPGQFVPVPGPHITLGLGWDVSKKKQVDLDASVVAIDAAGSILEKVSYRQLTGFGGAIKHKGDNRTGEGEGDDEEILFQLDQVPANCVGLAILIDSYTRVPLTEIKSAYLRLRDTASGYTFAFYRLSKLTDKCGLFFGCLYRDPSGAFFFRTAAQPVDGAGPEVAPHLIQYLKANSIL